MIPPRRLLISGGGIKVVAVVGALKVLLTKNKLANLKEVSGVSAGAWMAFMIACKTPIEVIERLIIELDFGMVRNLSVDTVMTFPETFGLDDGSKFTQLLEKVFRLVLKVDPNLTFADMKSNIAFRCWATDLVTLKLREFSRAQTPTVKIIDALRASCALPFYFTPFTDPLTGNLLSDGAIQGGMPLHILTEEELKETLSIGFTDYVGKRANPTDIMEFANSVMSIPVNLQKEILHVWKHHIIRIPIDNYPSWNFEASREDREMLMKKGSDAALHWLDRPHGRKITRRHSWCL